MTVEERTARLEQRADDRDVQLERIEAKVDRLLTAFNMGRGGAKAIAKLGGLLLLAVMGLGWLYQNVVAPLIGRHP